MRNTMLKRSMTILLAFSLFAFNAIAQESAAPLKAAEPQAPRVASQAANVRVELTITDQRSDAQPAPKTVTLLMEDRQNGRIRTGRGNATLNVDARPEIVREGRVRVTVSLEYTPQDGPDRPAQPPIQESVTALLDDGKTLLVSQSADPASDRKVRVELKATILK
jgi:hypothetical protein